MRKSPHSIDERSLLNAADYPIDEADHPARETTIRKVGLALANDGCAVIRNFLSPLGLKILLDEAKARRDNAFFSDIRQTNIYFSADDPALPADHPRRMFMERSNGFITSDCYGEETASRRLYYWPPLMCFIADCLNREQLFIYEDPIANMIVNVGSPGSQFNWHFDTNEFTITMLLKSADSGGHFEYVSNLRNETDECYDDVRAVLTGDERRVTRLKLTPGDLQLFLGRFSLHRVSENTGLSDRLLLIMSFAEKPGMIGSVERTRELYGKVTSLHLAAKAQRVRADTLMD